MGLALLVGCPTCVVNRRKIWFRGAVQLASLEKTVPYLGIEWQLLPATEVAGKKNEVVSVRRVITDSPACKAGVREGDIIRRVDGVALCAQHTLAALISAKKPGATVSLDLVRAKKRIHMKVTLGERQLPEFKFRPIESAGPKKKLDVNS
jgi:serine protease Do